MQVPRHSLLAALTELKRALPACDSGTPQEWAPRIMQALARLEQAVRRKEATLEAPGGELIDIDRGQIPSPGLDRHVDDIREELSALYHEASDLRRGLQHALEEAPHGLSPEVNEDFRASVAALAKGLERCEQEEARLVLETVNTDIGAGD
jgi:hypothetical protein